MPVRANTRKTLILLLAGSLAAGSMLLDRTSNAAARQKPPASAKPAPEKKTRPVNLEGDNLDADLKTGVRTARNFTFVDGDRTVTGDKAVYTLNKTTNRLVAEGSLTMDDPDYHATADKADIDNGKKKLAIFTGHVVLVIKPKDGGKTESSGEVGAAPVNAPGQEAPPPGNANSVSDARKTGVTITCDRVESHFRRKFAVLRGNLVFKQRLTKSNGQPLERILTAEHAEYDGKAEKMKLFPPVKGSDSDGQKIAFDQWVLVGTKAGAETLSSPGKFKSEFQVEESEEEEDESGAGPVEPAAPTPNPASNGASRG